PLQPHKPEGVNGIKSPKKGVLMPKIWFVVASQSAVKIFKRDEYDGNLRHLKTIENTSVHERAADLGRHSPGTLAIEPRQTPHQLINEKFAREAAEFLNHERKRECFDSLHLAAEPGFL